MSALPQPAACAAPPQVVDSFPTTASGKPQKIRMREAAIEELGLAAEAAAGLRQAAAG